MTRPETHPDQALVSEWWKPKKKQSNKPLQNGTGDQSEPDGAAQSSAQTNGVSKMEEEAEDSGTETELNEVKENGQLDGEDDEEEEEDDGKGPPKLFVLNFVNSYGNSQIEQLDNNGEPLKLSGSKCLNIKEPIPHPLYLIFPRLS